MQLNIFTFEVTIADTLKPPPGISVLKLSLVFELLCMPHPRTTDLRPVRFTVAHFITAVAGGTDSFTCLNDLGLSDSTTIQDCQLSSSGEADSDHKVYNIRFNSPRGWRPLVRAGQFIRMRHATVLFGRLTTVKMIRIKLFDTTNRVEKIELYGTTDGHRYFYHSQLQLTHVPPKYGEALVDGLLTTRGLRIVIVKQQNDDAHVEVSFDLLGCVSQVDDGKFDPCDLMTFSLVSMFNLPRPPTMPERRVYLYAEPNFMFCDSIVDPLDVFGERAKCYRSTNTAPETWFDFGPSVSQVISFIPGEQTIFALSADKIGIVRSTDMGKTWIGVNEGLYRFTRERFPGAVNATRIPWSVIPGSFDAQTTGAQCTAYPAGKWQLCYNGIYHNGQLKVDWNSKCPGFE